MAEVEQNNNAAGGGTGPGQNTPRAVAPTAPLITVRDRLFHTLFFRITLAYARGCARPLRRVIEMLVLIKVRRTIWYN